MSSLLQRPNGFLFGLAAPILFIVLQAPCLLVDARPESEQNPVGSRHTITADIEADNDWVLAFIVAFGPNEGTNSFCGVDDLSECESQIADCLGGMIVTDPEDLADCLDEDACEPSCSGSGDDTVRWTYESNGDEGTDVIVVCALDLDAEFESAIQQVGVLQDEEIPEELLEEIELIEEELGCDVVFKEWVDDDEDEDRVTNPGGVFAGDVGAAQRNRERARASVAVAATPRPAEASVRPPSTGDAGLHD
jgi:hypothetical protein